MDRNLWTQELTTTSCPPYRCVACGKGSLILVKDSLIYKDTAETAKSRGHEEFDWDWVSYIFTAWAQCTHSSCKQQYAISGDGGVEPQMNEEGDFVFANYFMPKSCCPMPDIIEFPPKCPEDVVRELRGAFAIFWLNEAACTTRLRVALEYLMTYLGVPKSKQGANDKLSDMSLHDRIDAFAKQEPAIGAQLMALKWLGNTGSHDSQVSANDLLDAFEIMEHALKEIVGGHSARMIELAKKLTMKHSASK